MKERFEDKKAGNLIVALKRQELVAGDKSIAEAIVHAGEVLEFASGTAIILEDTVEDDVFFLISGSVAIVVKGNQIHTRYAGQHVGEMAAIEPTQRRSATVVAQETLVVVKLSSRAFLDLGEQFPQIWLPLARELARRLFQRNNLIQAPNKSPRLFIISSAEALPIAYEIATQLERAALCTVWTNGVFFAGGYPLESLENAVTASDFAIAIAQPDDIVSTRDKIHKTIRDNVVFELGLFMGHLTRHRAFLIHPRADDLKLPSDMLGLNLLSYSIGKPDELAARIGPACNELRKTIVRLGVKTSKTGA
jgi:CRP/FNR family cyclic AMP-dependent transcriptional regulator